MWTRNFWSNSTKSSIRRTVGWSLSSQRRSSGSMSVRAIIILQWDRLSHGEPGGIEVIRSKRNFTDKSLRDTTRAMRLPQVKLLKWPILMFHLRSIPCLVNSSARAVTSSGLSGVRQSIMSSWGESMSIGRNKKQMRPYSLKNLAQKRKASSRIKWTQVCFSQLLLQIYRLLYTIDWTIIIICRTRRLYSWMSVHIIRQWALILSK